jgi:hypothetical protein
MAASSGPGRQSVDIGSLMTAVRDLGSELKGLSRRVDELTDAVKQLDGGDGAQRGSDGSSRRDTRTGPSSSRRETTRIAVTVRPLPELAMAAMAETSLRDLPGVLEVVASERVEDWARFTLEAEGGTDVIDEMRAAMPVAFTVLEPGPEEISVQLHWAWGTSG